MAEERSTRTAKQGKGPGRSDTERWLWVAALVVCIAALWHIGLTVGLAMLALGVEDPVSTAGRTVRWTTVGIVCFVAVGAVIRLGYDYQWTGFSERSLWDWLQLLIVPVVLTVGGFLFAVQQERRQQDIEDERAQATAYQAHIDQISRLLTEESLSESPEDEVRMVARAQTLSVLGTVEGKRKIRVLQFLAENRLIQGDEPIVDLRTADLRGQRLQDQEGK